MAAKPVDQQAATRLRVRQCHPGAVIQVVRVDTGSGQFICSAARRPQTHDRLVGLRVKLHSECATKGECLGTNW